MLELNGAAGTFSTKGLSVYQPAVRAYISRNIHDHMMVDDMMQEVLLRVHARKTGGTPIQDMAAYLYRVAANVLTDNARKARVRHSDFHKELTEQDHPVEELSPDRVLLAREQLSLIIDALNDLPERTRDIFILRRFEQTPYSEIARDYSISVSAVEKHVARAMHHIMEKLPD